MSEGSFVATSAGVSPESFPYSANRSGAVFDFLKSARRVFARGKTQEVYSGAPQMLIREQGLRIQLLEVPLKNLSCGSSQVVR